jgi:hypothetical protein
MPLTDLVPCFYTGQNYRVEQPVELRARADVHEFKRQKLGKFVENGRLFLFVKKLERKIASACDGPLGVGNAIPFARLHNYGDKLHYEIPMAGDRGAFARHRRKLIRVSARSGMRYAAALPPTTTFASSLLAG